MQIRVEERNFLNPEYFKEFISQRLLRVLCQNCRQEWPISENVQNAFKKAEIPFGNKIYAAVPFLLVLIAVVFYLYVPELIIGVE